MKIKQKNLDRLFLEILAIFRNYTLEVILCILGIGFVCAFSKYYDGTSIQAWALETGDAFLRGGYSGFGQIISQNLWKAPHGVLRDPFAISNLLYAIWNFPVLLVHYFLKTEYTISFAIRMWGKLYYIIIFMLCGYFIDETVYEISKNKRSAMIAAVLLWSSTTTLISFGYAMQDEIVYILFMLMGFNSAIRMKTGSCLIWLSVSCYICPLMLVFAIAIVLFLSNKLKELIYRIAVLLCATIFQMNIINSYLNEEANNQLDKMFNNILFSAGMGKISVFAVLILLIYFSAWSTKSNTVEEKNKYIFWRLSLLSLAICILGDVNFYRFFICIPFLDLNIMILDNEKKQVNGILSLVLFDILMAFGSLFRAGSLRISDFPNYVKKFLGLYSYPASRLLNISTQIFPNISLVLNICYGFVAALGIWILYLCHPKQKQEIVCPITIKSLLVIRSCMSIVLVVFLGMFFLRINILNVPIKTSILNKEDVKITSAIDGKNYLEQYYCGKSANGLLITIIPYIPGNDYPSEQKLNLDIVDFDSGEIMSSQSYNINELESGTKITYRVENIKIKKGHWYKFVFYSPDLIENEENYIYLFRSKDGYSNPQRYYANDFSNTENFNIVRQLITF